MKTSEIKSLKFFKGAGYLIGFAMALVGAIVVFVLSGNFAAAISAALPIGVGWGLGIERKFQATVEDRNPLNLKPMLVFLSLGLLIFFALYIFLILV